MAFQVIIGKDGSAPVMQANSIIPQFQITLIPSLGDHVPRKESRRNKLGRGNYQMNQFSQTHGSSGLGTSTLL